MRENGTMMQFFHWYIKGDGSLWTHVRDQIPILKDAGITALWLPPAYKGASGKNDVGYGVYDMYDLGEFDQKGSIRTKYGTKYQYLEAVQAAHHASIHVYADMVFNHRGGADGTEWVKAVRVLPDDRRFETGGEEWIEAHTHFHFPGRAKRYSDFVWRYRHFDGVDRAENLSENSIFKFLGTDKNWEQMVDDENGNYDYLMYADLDIDHPEVRTELARWGRWVVETTGVDGFRLDAIKHIKFSFFRYWLDYMRKVAGKELFAVGEYWNPYNVEDLHKYIQHTHGKMHLFDAPLHRNFYDAARAGDRYDMRKILDRCLMSEQPALAVTLVENHDTQPLQALESPVKDWFKPLAYAVILLRQEGYPCVFYPDYYGAEYQDKGGDGKQYSIVMAPVKHLPKLLKARKEYAYGKQHSYLDHPNVVGWTREGVSEASETSLAVLMSNGSDGYKQMYMGGQHSGKTYVDFLGNRSEKVTVDQNGMGLFYTNGGSVSVWVQDFLS